MELYILAKLLSIKVRPLGFGLWLNKKMNKTQNMEVFVSASITVSMLILFFNLQ